MALAAAVIGKNTAAKKCGGEIVSKLYTIQKGFLHKIALQKSGDMLL